MRNRTLLIVGLTALVLGLVGLATGPSPWPGGADGWWSGRWAWGPHAWMMGGQAVDHDEPSPDPIPEAETIDVVAYDFGFQPSRIVVQAGEAINIRLENEGFFFHDLTIPELDFHLNVQPGETVVGGLAELPPGEYRFECTVPMHAEMGMFGVLVVEDGSA